MPHTVTPKRRRQYRIHNAPPGITLLELLVAISVIATLCTIAIIVVPKSIERSRTTKCSANLRQLYVGLELFTQDNDGKFPSNMAAGVLWHNRLAPYLDVTIPDGKVAGAPPCEDSVFLCPSVYNDTGAQRSYALNSRMNDNNLQTDDLNISIRQPDKTVIIGDALNTSWLQTSNNLSYRHEGIYANVLFADGHVEKLTKDEAQSKIYTVFISGH